MSEAVEQIFFATAMHGIGCHELINCAYFLFAKALAEPKQLKQMLFLVCVVTHLAAWGHFSTLTAITRWKAAGSKDPLMVQNAWFVAVATFSSNS